MMRWEAIAASIARATGRSFTVVDASPAGCGSINRGYRVTDGSLTCFIKVNRPGLAWMFAAEAQGLDALAATGAIRVPQPICWGEDEASSWLVLEHLVLRRGNACAMADLGRCMAALHAVRVERFGWQRDNTIGSTPQHNDWSDSWLQFWREQRLGFQLGLAERNGYGKALRRADRLLSNLDRLLAHAPRASLLHGDLWGGNAAFTGDGQPVVYDPACYHGDREADIAMTELFGGFAPEFYTAYAEALPLPDGYRVRRDLYNLYHVLNHLNLFGGGYLAQASGMIDGLLSEIRG
jgi:protein-ribulosamine 3-kinase